MFNTDDSSAICIDIQEKLVNMLNDSQQKENAIKLLKALSILNINTIVTEQYPKGLGSTVEEIKNIQDFKTIEKTTFSALQTPEFKEEFDKLKNKNVIIFGIETHICVLQTVIDLLKEGYNVFVVEDCSSSRNPNNHNTALEIMKQKGAFTVNLEIVIFELLKSSKHENFKEIQALIK